MYKYLLLLLLVTSSSFTSSNVLAAPCTGESLIDVTLPTGGRWDMCWKLNDKEGVVFTDISYTTPAGLTRKVMKEASLSQIHVALDDGTSRFNAVTDLQQGGGLGVSGNIHDLNATDCQNGTLHTLNGVDALCRVTQRTGYIYKYYQFAKQGFALNLFSRSTINSSTYVVRWRFHDDGTIEPAVGLTGELPKVGTDESYGWNLGETNRVGVSFNNSYYWRLDFDIGTSATNDGVEQIEVIPSGNRSTKSMSIQDLDVEVSRSINEDRKRSWRVVDKNTTNSQGHPVSYHLTPMHTGHRYTGTATQAWAKNDFHVTRYDPCERHAVDNPTDGGCGENLSDFVNGQSLNSQDIVMWYRMNYHCVPRSEDEPEMQIHWDSFYIVPRDWTATNPMVSTFEWIDSVVGGV